MIERIQPLVRESRKGFMKKANCRRCGKQYKKTSKWNRICSGCNIRDSKDYKRLRKLHKWKVK